MNRLLVALSCLSLTATAAAQTGGAPPGATPGEIPGDARFAFDRPLPDVPIKRTASGRPDFNGVWAHPFLSKGDKEFYPLDTLMPDTSMLKPWAKAEFVRRWKALLGGYQIPNTSMLCLPAGPASVMMEAHALQIIQTDQEIVFLAESDHQMRIVYLNAKHPANLHLTWYGDAVGHWEGDTLVIDTIGINDKTQLDPLGTPHSAALHMVERMKFERDGRIDDLVTLDDILAFEHPWVYHYHYAHGSVEAQTENVNEYACAENNRDGYVPPQEPSDGTSK
jgi:hypothetical protein